MYDVDSIPIKIYFKIIFYRFFIFNEIVKLIYLRTNTNFYNQNEKTINLFTIGFGL
jgi:hypothetical protein